MYKKLQSAEAERDDLREKFDLVDSKQMDLSAQYAQHMREHQALVQRQAASADQLSILHTTMHEKSSELAVATAELDQLRGHELSLRTACQER